MRQRKLTSHLTSMLHPKYTRLREKTNLLLWRSNIESMLSKKQKSLQHCQVIHCWLCKAKQILGCGAVHMYKNGLINNSELGYLILEHLYPLPASISNARELQTITRQLMSVCVNLTVYCNSDHDLQIIAAVHQKNYIHRDIKPGNVMRNKDGSLRLIDFDVSVQCVRF